MERWLILINFKCVEDDFFFKKPKDFNKYSDKELLKYAVGANLYMNGLMDVYNKIKDGTLEDCTTITVCFEDAINEENVLEAEYEFINNLEKISFELERGNLKYEDIPLIFIRVRNVNQFKSIASKIKKNTANLIAGFVFPKFTVENGESYIAQTMITAQRLKEKFYIMPILESENIIYKESRIKTLLGIKELLDKYKDIVLNVRVGGTDFSSKFGLRRSVNSTVYHIKVVEDCLIDIINIFSRVNDGYVISGPVWEYFSDNPNSKEILGLRREIKMDIENGFIGKTVIHPSQVNYVNLSHIVSYEDYKDAIHILKSKAEGGVFKGYGDNKMNEISPHLNWARKIIERAEVFGVRKENFEGNKELLNIGAKEVLS